MQWHTVQSLFASRERSTRSSKFNLLPLIKFFLSSARWTFPGETGAQTLLCNFFGVLIASTSGHWSFVYLERQSLCLLLSVPSLCACSLNAIEITLCPGAAGHFSISLCCIHFPCITSVGRSFNGRVFFFSERTFFLSQQTAFQSNAAFSMGTLIIVPCSMLPALGFSAYFHLRVQYGFTLRAHVWLCGIIWHCRITGNMGNSANIEIPFAVLFLIFWIGKRNCKVGYFDIKF